MKLTTLGPTDRQISIMGLGAMPMSLRGRPPESQSIEIIRTALERGVRLIDTADSYCIDNSDFHHNESLIRRALDDWDGDRHDVTVATKGGLVRPDGRWETDGDPARLRETIHQSWETLGNRPIDLWQLHAPDPNYTIEEQLQPALEARDENMIRHIGVSNFSVDQLKQAREITEIVSVQNQFNPWRRDPERNGVLDYCDNHGLTFLPWSPMGGSSRAESIRDIDVLTEIAGAHTGASPYQVVLAWLRSKSRVVVPIPGASRLESLNDSLDAQDLTLSSDEISTIDDHFASG